MNQNSEIIETTISLNKLTFKYIKKKLLLVRIIDQTFQGL